MSLQDEIVRLSENLYKLFQYLSLIKRGERSKVLLLIKKVNSAIEKVLKQTDDSIVKTIKG
jgi:hypothetical protein